MEMDGSIFINSAAASAWCLGSFLEDFTPGGPTQHNMINRYSDELAILSYSDHAQHVHFPQIDQMQFKSNHISQSYKEIKRYNKS